MTRKEYEQRSWTSIKRKLPPNNDEILLLWNPYTKESFTQIGWLSYNHAELILEIEDFKKVLKKFAIDRIFSHWRRVIGPK